MSQFKRYLNIINELKVPERGSESIKKTLKDKNVKEALEDLKLKPRDLTQKQNEEVFNAYFNYKHHEKVPEWSEIRSAMTGSIASYIKREKIDKKVAAVLLKMLKASVKKSGFVGMTVKNNAIDDLEVEDYIKNPSIIHKIIAGEIKK